jgi:hypothetical protein
MMAKGIDVRHAIPGVGSAAANTGWQGTTRSRRGPLGTLGVLRREMPSSLILRECEKSGLTPRQGDAPMLHRLPTGDTPVPVDSIDSTQRRRDLRDLREEVDELRAKPPNTSLRSLRSLRLCVTAISPAARTPQAQAHRPEVPFDRYEMNPASHRHCSPGLDRREPAAATCRLNFYPSVSHPRLTVA